MWPFPRCLIHSEPKRPKEISQGSHVPTLFPLFQVLAVPFFFCWWTPWGSCPVPPVLGVWEKDSSEKLPPTQRTSSQTVNHLACPSSSSPDPIIQGPRFWHCEVITLEVTWIWTILFTSPNPPCLSKKQPATAQMPVLQHFTGVSLGAVVSQIMAL